MTLSDPTTQKTALRALGATGDVRAVPAVVAMLDAKSTPIRAEAMMALAKLRLPETIEPLIHTLKNQKTNRPGMRAKAAIALAQFSDPRVVPALIGALVDRDPKVNAAAAEVLGRLGSLRAVPVLIAIVEDPDRTAPEEEQHKWKGFKLARAAAITALGKLGDSRAIPSLIHAMSDDYWEVGHAVTQALAVFGEASVPSLVGSLASKDWRTRERAVLTLDILRSYRHVLFVTPLLKDPNYRVRKSAALYLGQSGDPRAIPALVETLDDTSAVDSDATEAVALASLGKEGREALKAVLSRQTGQQEKCTHRSTTNTPETGCASLWEGMGTQ